MGKKSRKTRWRTLTIADEHSDSEESNTNSVPHQHHHHPHHYHQPHPKGYQQKSYYNRFTYSSQSTPTRRYQQYDSTKSTRSSSTASENKITFNEDEYTRITTPRQDVLFKKGYLNKPKTYQTQTSTGTSTTSTGNSTGNGTPDHQSTDLEYESQFVFPNGFLDQNGIYYVNSYEGYPLMLYNPPTPYYHEFSNVKSKRYSTGSLTESTSPNEETTSQEPSQSETPNNLSELNNHHTSSYNIVYPGFYFNGNGPCQSQDVVGQSTTPTEPPRRLKKKKRRKPSSSPNQQESAEHLPKKHEEADENGCSTSEYTDGESSYSDDEEVFLNKHAAAPVTPNPTPEPDVAAQNNHLAENGSVTTEKDISNTCTTEERKIDAQKLLLESLVSEEQKQIKDGEDVTITNGHVASADEQPQEKNHVILVDTNSQQSYLLEEKDEGQQQSTCLQQREGASCSNKTFALKPDAEEFIPRAYRRRPESIPFDPGVHPHHQFIKMGPPNFVPMPMLSPMTAAEFQGHHHHHPNFTHHHHHPAAAFIPPGIPINFVPHHQNFINFVPSNTNNNTTSSNGNYNNCNGDMEGEEHGEPAQAENCPEEGVMENKEINEDRIQEAEARTVAKIVNDIPQQVPNKDKKNTDISTIVSKLEQTGKEQNEDAPSQNGEQPLPRPANEINSSPQTSPVHRANKDVMTGNNRSSNGFGRSNNNYGKFRNSNNRRMNTNNTDDNIRTADSTNQRRPFNNRFDPDRRRRPNWKQQPFSSPKKEPYTKGLTNGVSSPPVVAATARNYSETVKRTQTMSAQQFPSLSSGESRNEISLSKEQTSKQQPENKADQVTSGEVKKAVAQTNNQWIPVSSKKKRKNRNNMEELDEEFEETTNTTTTIVVENKDEGLFESYDVTLLEDVVVMNPPTPAEIIVEEKTEEIVKVIPEVDGEPAKIDVESIIIEVIAETVILDEKPEIEDPAPKEDRLKTVKKKSKKGYNKAVAKRVIITDIDLTSAMAAEPVVPAPAVTPTAAAVNEEKIEAAVQPKEPEIPEVATPETITASLENREDTEDEPAPTTAEPLQCKVETETKRGDKKSTKRKKKKPQTKPSLLHSQSNSSSNLNLTDDSYDFLLETATLDDSSEKTNVEVSQELDKLIQRGMYSNLEEKIKSLNMPDVTDGFFKTIIGNISRTSRESSIEKTNYIRTASDFGSILMKNTALSRPKFPIVDAPSTSRQQHSTPSTSSLMGDFLGVGSPILGESQLETGDLQTECCQQRLTQNDPTIEQQPQFPITQAVKEWVNKTRENTPEVEIFKSPSTIFKEFALNEDDNQIQEELLDEEEDETEETPQKNATGNSLRAESPENAGELKGVAKSDSDAMKSDDEVTLYSREQSVDLLQCWEDETPTTPNEPTPTSDVSVAPEPTKVGIVAPKMCANGAVHPPGQNDPDLVGESIEIYESKYGKNEDYLRIKAEVEKKKQNGESTTTNSYPRHGNLPYRAVCCSIM